MKKVLFILLIFMSLALAFGALGEFPSWLDSLGDINISGGGISPVPPVDNTCNVCGKDPCICDPVETCETCGELLENCTCGSDPKPPEPPKTCDTCGELLENCTCGSDPKPPEPPKTCDTCGELLENCTCGSDPPETVETCLDCGEPLNDAGYCYNYDCESSYYYTHCYRFNHLYCWVDIEYCPFCCNCGICEEWYDGKLYDSCPYCVVDHPDPDPDPDPVETCPECDEPLKNGLCYNVDCEYSIYYNTCYMFGHRYLYTYNDCPYCVECNNCVNYYDGKLYTDCPNCNYCDICHRFYDNVYANCPYCIPDFGTCDGCGFDLGPDGCYNSDCEFYYYRRDCDCGEWWDVSVYNWCQNPECPYYCYLCGYPREKGYCTNIDCSDYIAYTECVCGQIYDGNKYVDCPNENCILKAVLCEFCKVGYRVGTEGACSYSLCSTNIIFSFTSDGKVYVTPGLASEYSFTLYRYDGSEYVSVNSEYGAWTNECDYGELSPGMYYVSCDLWVYDDNWDMSCIGTIRSGIVEVIGSGSVDPDTCDFCGAYLEGGYCYNDECPSNSTTPNYFVEFSESGKASCDGVSCADWYLYRENGDLVAEYLGAASPVDFSMAMNNGERYYVVVAWIQGDNSDGEYYSATVTFYEGGDGGDLPPILHCPKCTTGHINESGECSNVECSSHYVVNYTVTFTSHGEAFCNTIDAKWELYDADTGEIKWTFYAQESPVDFSPYMESGSRYYVIVSGISDDPYGGSFMSKTVVCDKSSEGGNTGLLCEVCWTGYINESGECSNVSCDSYAEVKYTVYLYANGLVICPGVTDARWVLYDATTGYRVTFFDTEGSPVDFSEYMEDGHEYYVVVSSILGDSSQGVYMSNKIICDKQFEDDLSSPCPCGKGYISEGTGFCNNPDCENYR